ncbi:DUF1428 domain-containing protein [Glaciecola sp. MF2-115]|uniref:DUF1428 domain-containing protein n=1 Tax=Glaciecola sp. MF2-115 TaxID=3384827 RepID=UPI0039A1A4C3
MANYIDGFTLPIQRSHINEYQTLAEKVANIWKEHGAIDYKEYVGDDLSFQGLRSFTDLVEANEDDFVVFGWVTFESREARDLANAKVAADPRMEELVAKSNSGFDAAKMVYGGFKSLV